MNYSITDTKIKLEPVLATEMFFKVSDEYFKKIKVC